MNFLYPLVIFGYSCLIVCRASCIDSNSVTGWDCSCCLAPLTPARSRVPALYVPIPQLHHHHQPQQYAEGLTEEEEGDGGGERQKARGPTFSTLALLCFTRHADLKASSRKERVCVCRESEDLSGGKCTTTAETRAFPRISPSPLYIQYYTHTCLYIHSEHKAFTISGLLHIQMPRAGHGNKKRENACSTACSVYSNFMCVSACHVCPLVHACLLSSVFICIFYILSLPWSHFETLQVLRSVSLGIGYSPQQHQGTR